MGVNVVQIIVGRKYRRVTGTDQLPMRVVKVVANVFNEIRCFGAAGGFNCCHNSFFFVPGTRRVGRNIHRFFRKGMESFSNFQNFFYNLL